MATTQYIGARYVPKFAEPVEWDKTLDYENLIMVKHQGNTYITRRYVPAGVEISDEKYWVLLSNFNAQIEQYRQEVQAFAGRITTNAEGVSANAAAIASEANTRADADATLTERISDEVTARTAEDTKLNEAISAHSTELNNLQNTVNYNDSEIKYTVTPYISGNVACNIVELLPSASLSVVYPVSGSNRFELLSTYSKKMMLGGGGLGGALLSGGNILRQASSAALGNGYINITESGELSWIADASATLTAEQVKSRGGYNCIRGFWIIMENGQKVTQSDADIKQTSGTVFSNTHSRMFFGTRENSDSIFAVIVEGRTPYSAGITGDELYSIARELNFVNAYNADGGGSMQCFVNSNSPINIVFSNDENIPQLYADRSINNFIGLE